MWVTSNLKTPGVFCTEYVVPLVFVTEISSPSPPVITVVPIEVDVCTPVDTVGVKVTLLTDSSAASTNWEPLLIEVEPPVNKSKWVKLVSSFTTLKVSNSTCGVYVSAVNAKLEKVTEPAPLRVVDKSVLSLESNARTV